MWRPAGLIACLLSLLCLAASVPAAQADVLPPWGSTLSATPTLDTANGASTTDTAQKPASLYYGDNRDEAVATGFGSGCTRRYDGGGTVVGCTPWMHDGADGTVWNTMVDGAQATAPQGGQVLSVTVKGCAVADPNAPSDNSEGTDAQGNKIPVPANEIEFEGLSPQADGSMKVNNVAGGPSSNPFELPWCNDAKHQTGASANTETTYHPLHMCMNPGDIVSFYDLGGYVPQAGTGGYYPQGVPFRVIAQDTNSHMQSMMDSAESSYSPGQRPAGDNTGWGDEPGKEVLLQVTEGVGADAYGLCPGGAADEPSTGNTINCDYSKLLAGRSSNGHPICGQSSSGGSTGGSSGTTTGTGGTSGASSANTPKPTPRPALTRLKLNPARFYRSKGSTITYSDNVAGLTRFVVLQQVTVKRKHKLKTIRTFTHTDHPGGQGVAGKLTRMKPGRYVMQVTVAYGGQRSVTYTLDFTVLK